MNAQVYSRVIGLTIIFSLLLVCFHSFSPSLSIRGYLPKKKLRLPFVEVFQKVHAPFIHPITAPHYVTYEGYNFTMKNPPIWTEPLGKDFCIVDIDNRPFVDENQLFDNELQWKSFDTLSAGFMNHYTYALIHGYTYKFINVTKKPSDRYITWLKVPAIIDQLKECKFILNVEGDGIFKELTLPMEWQMNYWNFTKDTKVAIPAHPAEYWNMDLRGNINLNTGYILAQNTPRTFEIWETWKTCVESVPGCDKFISDWPAEQGAYSSFIRYMYTEPGDLLTIPCSEANGFPESGSDCNGTLNYQHYWTDKRLVKEKGLLPIAQLMMQRLHLDFLARKDRILIKNNRTYY